MPSKNTWANRVANVSSLITRYLTMASIRRSPHHSPFKFVHVQCISFNRICCHFNCCCLSVLFVSLPVALIPIYLFLFDHPQFCFCYVWFALFDYSVFVYLIIQCYFLSWYWNCVQVFQSPFQQPSSKSINIIHKTAPSFVLIEEARAYYHHRHLWYIWNQYLQAG